MTSRPTRTEDIYRQIRRDILIGKLRPSEKLAFNDLATRYGASSGVLREVLPRLQERGLATWEAQLGFRVIPVSLDDLRELTDTRIFIETEALRLSIAHGALQWEVAVISSLHVLSNTPKLDDDSNISVAWLEAHAQFHHMLLDGCPNRRLLAIASQLRDSAEVYRCWARTGYERSHIDLAAEHQELHERALARDTEGATALLSAHIQATSDMLAKSVEDRAFDEGKRN